MAEYKQQNGKAYPLGSVFDGKGVNFALFSAHAEKVELCFFDEAGKSEIARFVINESNNGIWHTYIRGAKAGQVYGYRVYGPYRPSEGLRFNPNKLLFDPYGKKLRGRLIWHKAIFGYDTESPDKDLSFSPLDSAPYVPKSVVVAEDDFDWGNVKAPQTDWEQTVVYEAHVKGFTRLHPQVEDAKRGKFAGLATAPVKEYLQNLGVTALELLPVHAFLSDQLRDDGRLNNYWGYESYSFFALEPSYAGGDEIREFKQMVKSLHQSGIEVWLDVVYNHTGEGNQMGPTLCYRGIDNSSYYMLNPENKRYYYDSTGCGSTFNAEHPQVVQLILDSLRYFAGEMQVDGFRFDLASSLCRRHTNFTTECGFLYALRQDPQLKGKKMVAEPWDLGSGGYQLGAFPADWGEWNDRYRDVIRRFWKGDQYQTAELASRISGSSDVFNYYNRGISSSVNFVTAHDGFCLNDLVSYNQKHNSANGEDNRDGSNSNWSWNSGAEGQSGSAKVRQNRKLRLRALLSTLMLSFGTPMLSAGDEFLCTHLGNNNPYCQDNALSWLAWEAADAQDLAFAEFVQKLIALRRELQIFNRRRFFSGKTDGDGVKDLTWYTEHGSQMFGLLCARRQRFCFLHSQCQFFRCKLEIAAVVRGGKMAVAA